MSNIKHRLLKLESDVLVKTEVPIKLHPEFSREQWINLWGGGGAEAEPLSEAQHEWVAIYGH